MTEQDRERNRITEQEIRERGRVESRVNGSRKIGVIAGVVGLALFVFALVVGLAPGLLPERLQDKDSGTEVAFSDQPPPAAIDNCNREAEQAARESGEIALDEPRDVAGDGTLVGLREEFRASPAARAAYRDCMLMGEY